MKKLYYLIVLALILGLVLTGCSLLSNVGQVPTTEQSGITYLTKGIPGDPDVFPLYAGQHIDVGTVEVWNDTDNLYVKYVVNDPWRLTETHLHIFFDDMNYTDVPQKNGNPIPGKFDYKDEHDCVTEYTYTIPLTLVPEDELFIAAHAVVADTSITMEEVVVSRPGIDVYGPLGEYAGLGDIIWGSTNPAVATFVSSWPSILGATWISTAYYTEEPVENKSWRWFHDEINLPEKGYYIAGSVVLATADDTGEVYFNGESAGSNVVLGVLTEYSIEPQPGPNTLDFIVMNSSQTDVDPVTPETNPNGLIYKATVTYYPEETAWGAGLGFPGANWATYFTYNLQEVLIDTGEVFSDGEMGPCSVLLKDGENYRLDVSGTYIFAKWTGAGIADAKYSLRPAGICNDTGSTDWISGDDLVACYGDHYLELLVDGDHQAWGDFNPAHTYSMEYYSDGSSVCFSILDTAYGDNSGSLKVEIYWIP